jgi:hypothetical protein
MLWFSKKWKIINKCNRNNKMENSIYFFLCSFSNKYWRVARDCVHAYRHIITFFFCFCLFFFADWTSIRARKSKKMTCCLLFSFSFLLRMLVYNEISLILLLLFFSVDIVNALYSNFCIQAIQVFFMNMCWSS